MLIITAIEFQRNINRYQDVAAVEPVSIVRGDGKRFVLISEKEYQQLQRLSRRVIRTCDLDDNDIALLEKTEMSDEHTHLNTKLK